MCPKLIQPEKGRTSNNNDNENIWWMAINNFPPELFKVSIQTVSYQDILQPGAIVLEDMRPKSTLNSDLSKPP